MNYKTLFHFILYGERNVKKGRAPVCHLVQKLEIMQVFKHSYHT